MAIKLEPIEIIHEFERRGVTLEPHEASSTGFALNVGSSGAAIPDWLITNLEDNSDAVAAALYRLTPAQVVREFEQRGVTLKPSGDPEQPVQLFPERVNVPTWLTAILAAQAERVADYLREVAARSPEENSEPGGRPAAGELARKARPATKASKASRPQ